MAVSTCHRGRRAWPGEVPLAENTVPATGGGPGGMVGAVLTASALHALSAGRREVIAELLCRGRPAAEVATALGIPAGTVRSRCFYGLRVLPHAAGEQGVAGSCARARVSRRLAACRGCRAGYGELVPAWAWLGRLVPAAPLTGRLAGAMAAVRDWSDQ
jgi:Sigma-70, region 4